MWHTKTTPRILTAVGKRPGCQEQSPDPMLPSFGNRSAVRKVKYHGEPFPSSVVADQQGTTYPEFFQRDQQTSKPKGIVAIDLESFP